MSNDYAVIIGIDAYQRPLKSLDGAVDDALRMRDWLIARGGVPEDNVTLLLSPGPGKALPGGVQAGAADYDSIVKAIADLIRQTGEPGQGDRLFFYYAGHGLTSRINFADEDAIVASDFTELLTNKSITTRSLLDFFKGTQFRDQFFIIDACRDVPWSSEMVLGVMPRPRKHDPAQPAVQQFVFYATSPGLKAVDARGTLTETMVAGLKGVGRAKSWDPDGERYVVTVDRLFEYVKAEFEAHQRSIGRDANHELYQVPRRGGEYGGSGLDSNPILAQYPAEAIQPVPLRVNLDPKEIINVAQIVIRDLDAERRQDKLTKLPVEFDLPPREYSVAVSATNYVPAKKRWIVELYDPMDETLSLSPSPGEPISFGIVNEELESGSRGPTGPTATGPGRLVATCADPIAPLELSDRKGRRLRIAAGRLDVGDLDPGFYRVLLRSPDGPIVSEAVAEVPPGNEGPDPVAIEVPRMPGGRIVRALVEAGAIDDVGGGGLAIPGVPGTLMTPQVSTFLLLSDRATATRASWGRRLGQLLGWKAFEDRAPAGTTSGFRAYFADEHDPPEQARAVVLGLSMRLWPRDLPLPETDDPPEAHASATLSGLGEYFRAADPGAYWLAIAMPGLKPTAFPVTLLPGRLTEWVFHLDAAGRINIFQYFPPLHPAAAADASSLRRLEDLQRLGRSGQLDHARQLAGEVLDDWLSGVLDDTMAGALGLSTLLAGEADARLDGATRKLLQDAPDLSDGHALRGAYLSAAGSPAEAAVEYRKSLEIGLPTIAHTLKSLGAAVEGLQPPPERRELLDRVLQSQVPGVLWSGWTPETFLPGRPLS